ncbi:MAG: thioredoxin family protein [Marinifilaceae bacterium]
MVHNLDEALFKEKIFNYDMGDKAPLLIKNNTIIEFWVTWCPHCQAMAPRYEKVSGTLKQVDCYRIELEQHPALAELFGVSGFPTFIFITPQGDMNKWVGELPEEGLIEMAQDYLKI